MSANATAAARIADRAKTLPDADRGHRIRLYSLYVLAFASNLAIFIYGFDYYKLSAIDRPFSPKHHMLRPSGPIGLYLGFIGVALFVGIFLYPIRKHWAWLAQFGKTRHWRFAEGNIRWSCQARRGSTPPPGRSRKSKPESLTACRT